MLVFICLVEFQVRCLALFRLSSVIVGFEQFWIGSRLSKTLLMLVFLEAPFFVLHFLYYTLIVFLVMLSEILLSKLMILFCASDL